MKYLVLVLGVIFAVQSGSGTLRGSGVQHSEHLCEGFAKKNNHSYPVQSARIFLNAPTMTEADFNALLDRVEALYAPEVAARGKKLVVNRMWDSPEANAFAHREPNNEWHIDMHGGLARHPKMSDDGFLMVTCHEIGHHLGGTPHAFKAGELSNEGQSDYFAALKCFRRLFTVQENRAWLQMNTVDPLARAECTKRFANQNSQLSCMRAAHAGINLGTVLASLNEEKAEPVLGQVDSAVVARTRHGHPASQCRVDTYFAGAVCNRRVDAQLSDSDELAGTCEKVNGYDLGFRPRCWFAPSVPDSVLIDQVAAL